ncbi:MAG: nitrous oxide reductase family maturation protein NosD [Ignavibacteriae bacterium]|nr:nitrous oxide reductase family maturation protein NosD [Ignavibacteriota bacterium]
MKRVFNISLFSLFCFIFSPPALYSGVIYVGGESNIISIRQALETASDGDIIIIKEGIYKEYNLIVSKKLQIIGENYPVIDGDGKDEIFTVRADGCVFKNLVIKNTGISFLKDIAGIKVENCKNVLIENNIFDNTFFAVYLSGTDSCKIISNNVIGSATSESFSGNGIHLWKCRNILIENNQVSGQRDGIYIEFSTYCKINKNFSYKNLRYGLHFMFSEGNSYVKNTFRQNGAGVAVMYTKNIEMINNSFEDNWGPNSYGLLLKDIDKSYISGNSFRRNTTGIYMEGSNGTTINGNSFFSNGWAIKILGNCYEDSVKNNNFLNNTFDVSTNSSQNSNLFDSNYWDKYYGYDLDKDSFGDVPYRPVSLFSTVAENSPDAMLLLRSFLVDLLDVTEKVFPVFIPETLVDNKPQMKMIYYDKN